MVAKESQLPCEVESYFLDGHNIVYYCHKGRRPYEQWEAHKSLMFNRIKNAKPAILTYHKGSQRSYIFLIHEKDFVRYRKVIDSILSGWYKVFSEEYTSKGNAAGEAVGDSFDRDYTDEEILESIHFQEKYFEGELLR